MIRVFILIFLALVAINTTAYSCDCPFKPEFKEAIEEADFIFSGIVLSEEIICYEDTDTGWVQISREEAKEKIIVYWFRRVYMNILNKYTGDYRASKIYVETPVGSSMCEFSFQVGKRYIVYTSGNMIDNIVYTSRCDRTMEYDKSEHRRLKKTFKKR